MPNATGVLSLEVYPQDTTQAAALRLTRPVAATSTSGRYVCARNCKFDLLQAQLTQVFRPTPVHPWS